MDTHGQIKEICAVPINTALICLIWSDQEIRDKFQKNSNQDFNISRLYSEIIICFFSRCLLLSQFIISLYKRLIYKNKTEANNHLKNKMSFLEQIAYESFVATGK
ncbi:hypothetical protein [Rickettsia parkeri]|uniref:hypothetical protein n=1 Tax=Rickettsia parkeri TaxID=35792 RepID=UPI0021C1E1AA|nr:hypothetical protein [Rickettsia parkeri]